MSRPNPTARAEADLAASQERVKTLEAWLRKVADRVAGEIEALDVAPSDNASFRQPLTESERNAIRASWGQKPLAEHVARCPRCGKGVGAKKDTDGAFRVLDHKRDIDEGRCSGVGQAVTEVVAI